MKRASLSFLLLMLTAWSFAQNEHVKFMGIPLNGTIQQFHQKLVGKGCGHDVKTSNMLGNGARAFKGTFAGNKADIVIFYDESTKIVYRAKAIISCYGESARDSKFNDMKDLLDTKYGPLFSFKDTHEGYDSYVWSIFSEASDQLIGTVGIFVTENELGFHEYSLHVDYYDFDNNKKHDQKRLDDI